MQIAASKMYGAFRRSFQTQMCLKYSNGSLKNLPRVKRLSMDCKATVNIGDYSR